MFFFFFFFFKQKTAYEIYQCDWSSDVCSSDLESMVSRKKGLHMTIELKNYGEGLYKMWLIESHDERNPEIKNLHKL